MLNQRRLIRDGENAPDHRRRQVCQHHAAASPIAERVLREQRQERGWCGQKHRNITDAQKELLRQIVAYIVTNGSCSIADIRENDKTYAAQLIRSFGNRDKTDESLSSLSQFLIYRKIS